jgi:hypothetical protein
MKKLIKLTIGMMLSAVYTAHPAIAEGTRGGGGAWVCDKTLGSATNSTESYDLYEGKNRYHFKIPAWDGKSTKEKIIADALALLSKKRPGLAEMVARVLAKVETVLPDSDGVPIWGFEDIPGSSGGKGCGFKQIYYWIDGDLIASNNLQQETIYRSSSLYNSKNPYFDPQSQATIDLHEAFYKIKRGYFGNDGDGSEWVRKGVASMFSGKLDEEALEKCAKASYTEAGVYLADKNTAGYVNEDNLSFLLPFLMSNPSHFFSVTTNDLDCSESQVNIKASFQIHKHGGRIRYSATNWQYLWKGGVMGANAESSFNRDISYMARIGYHYKDIVSLRSAAPTPADISFEITGCDLGTKSLGFDIESLDEDAYYFLLRKPIF